MLRTRNHGRRGCGAVHRRRRVSSAGQCRDRKPWQKRKHRRRAFPTARLRRPAPEDCDAVADGGTRLTVGAMGDAGRRGIAPGAFVRGGDHDPQPCVERQAGTAGEGCERHADPDVFHRPAQMRREAGAYARDDTVGAADQRRAGKGGAHVSIQARIRVPRTRFRPEPGVTQGRVRVFPSRAEPPRTAGSKYELADPYPRRRPAHGTRSLPTDRTSPPNPSCRLRQAPTPVPRHLASQLTSSPGSAATASSADATGGSAASPAASRTGWASTR